MNLWDDFKTPQVKLRRRSSIFNVVLPEDESLEIQTDSIKYEGALKQESVDWVHLLKNQNGKLRIIKNRNFEENQSMLGEEQRAYLEKKINHAELADDIAKINNQVYFYIKRKEYLIKKHNFYSELLDERLLECALEILPRGFK